MRKTSTAKKFTLWVKKWVSLAWLVNYFILVARTVNEFFFSHFCLQTFCKSLAITGSVCSRLKSTSNLTSNSREQEEERREVASGIKKCLWKEPQTDEDFDSAGGKNSFAKRLWLMASVSRAVIELQETLPKKTLRLMSFETLLKALQLR